MIIDISGSSSRMIEPIAIHISDETRNFLEREAERLGRSVSDLASCAVEEYCLSLMKRVSK